MADLIGVEIARPGEWELSSGPLTVTEQMLRDAADYANRPDARPSPVKLGHVDPRFDGEPSLGWLMNLHVDDNNGPVLVGDIIGMPDWLSSTVQAAYPDRSVEGWADYQVDGRTYSMVIDGLALLGVTPPGMSTIRSLRDLPQALGVAASARFVAMIAAAAVSNTAWSSFTAADYDDAQWRRACLIHLSNDPAKSQHKLPVREPDGTLNRNGCHAAASVLGGGRGGVNAPPDKITAARRTLAGLYTRELKEQPPASLTAAAVDEAPAAASASGSTTDAQSQGGNMPSFTDEQVTTLRQRLGIADENADGDAILAALEEALTERADPQGTGTPAPPPPAPPAETPPAVVPVAASHGNLPAGAIVLDSSALEALQASAKRGEAAFARMAQEDRDRAIDDAVTRGKIAAARRPHWQTAWDKDPDGTKQALASMPANLIPVKDVGYAGDDSDGPDEYSHLFPPKGA